jgi:hypothetical protein
MSSYRGTLVGVGEPTCEHSSDLALAAETEHVRRRDPTPFVPFALEHALDAPERPRVAALRELRGGRPALRIVARREATHQPAPS